jgi:hypothetical protein
MRFALAPSRSVVEGAIGLDVVGVQMLVESRAWCASTTSGRKSWEKTEFGRSSWGQRKSAAERVSMVEE